MTDTVELWSPIDLIDEKPIEQPYIVFPAQLKVRSSTSRVK